MTALLTSLTGQIILPMSSFVNAAREKRVGPTSLWQLALLAPPIATAPSKPGDPFQAYRHFYRPPVLSAERKHRIAMEFLATRGGMFRENVESNIVLWSAFAGRFAGSGTQVGFVILPEDRAMQPVDHILRNEFDMAVARIARGHVLIDLRDLGLLEPSDFYDQQHLVASGRQKILPAIVKSVAAQLSGCHGH
jgi:hypothetical protein